jgi:two-component system OmpR family sensor kinase
MRSLVPRSLTSRLVVTAVALVAMVGILVGLSATLVMRGILTDRLDQQIRDAVPHGFAQRNPAGPTDPEAPNTGGPGLFIVGGSIGNRNRLFGGGLFVVVRSGVADGGISTQDGTKSLTAATVNRLTQLPHDGDIHSFDVNGAGYRVQVLTDSANNFLIIGMPTRDIDETLQSLITTFGLLTLIGVGIAGIAGTGLVRHQLQPLRAVADTARKVASQDLSSGETTITTRVDAALAASTNEVGQVGSALNTLLDHVDNALAARHRSEQQVRQFVADASHELRTPLSTIHGYAELSRRTPEDPSVLATALNKVETEADRMSALVEDLLLLARLDAGRPLARDEVDLTDHRNR